MSWFAKFMASSISGWLFILALVFLTGTVGGSIYYIKELQRKAAYCEGQLETAYNREKLEKKVTKIIRTEADDTIEEVEDARDAAKEVIESRPEPEANSPEVPSGCAAERADESILRYHGWLLDK